MRRKKKSILPDNFNPLLDTMTNVVGVLVIMLAIAQLSIGATVRKIKILADPVGQVDFDEESKLKEKLLEDLKTVQLNWGEMKSKVPDYESEITTLRHDSLRLGREITKMNNLLARKKYYNDELGQSKQVIDRLTKTKQTLNEKIVSLDKTLGGTPKPVETSGPYQLSLPNPGVPSFESERVDFYCYQGKIHLIQARTIASIRKKMTFVIESKLNIKNRDQLVDCNQVINLFKKDLIKDRNYLVHMKKYYGEAKVVISPKSSFGENMEQMLIPGSNYLLNLNRITTGQIHLHFHVDPSSYDLYLAARKIARERSIKTGWSPLNSGGEIYFRINEKYPITCNGTYNKKMPVIVRKKNKFDDRRRFNLNLNAQFLYDDIID